MSLAAAHPPAAARDQADGSLLGSPTILAVLALALSVAKFWPDIVTVWTTGAFANTDDAMRLVEVRDWLAGQAWFDLHQYRLDPPGGVDMHWTRVLDVPLAFLIKAFSMFLQTGEAERLTRIVFPLTLLFFLCAAVVGLARRLAGPAAMLPAAIMVVAAGAVFAHFEPGRIHHHVAQILLVVLILRATIDAVDDASVGRAALAATLAALSLSINVENITYILVEIAVFALVFVARGQPFARALASFAITLAVASLVMFVATIGPSHYFTGACDAFSNAHLMAIFIGAAAFVVMAAGARLLSAWPLRLAASALGAAVVIGALALAFPSCLGDPQAGVTPLLRAYWLSKVEEARPLIAMILAKPSNFFIFACAPLLGLLAALLAAWREREATRVNWLIVAAFAAMGVATSLWQVRAISSASALALFGGVFVAAHAMNWAHRQKSVLAKLSPILVVMPFCSTFWAIAAAAAVSQPAEPGKADPKTCRSPATMQTLAALPKSLLMAPIDMGSDILAQTAHSVLAAPYHRNNHGNGEMVRAMLAKPDEARKIVADSGAAYVVFCASLPETGLYAAGEREGLAAMLLNGRAPDWLAPVAAPPDAPIQIYRIR
jgi:hypothetical protein